ncbi:hypothetical protein RND81_10G172200 [Saponaria officinalis]|uniref:Retrovirus-related Pol polyprotein from transposon TNT 1-94-like beta-barrel domain-containing protein n=1 Tax=Saponaria officinalis TaxID=3572 RepID=A0AAW1I2S8_SAPOF
MHHKAEISGNPSTKIAAYVEEATTFEGDTPSDELSSQSASPKIDPAFVQAVVKEMYKVFQNPPTSESNFPKFGGMILVSIVNSGIIPSSVVSWIIDSGASDHMTFTLFDFTKYFRLPKPVAVTLPDGQQKLVNFCGTVALTDKLCLHNVLYLPDFKHKLLSLGKLLEDSKLVANFHVSGCSIQDLSTKEVLLSG